MRLARKRSQSGWIVRSFLATMYQLGFDFEAVPATFASNRSGAGTVWVAQTSFLSCSDKPAVLGERCPRRECLDAGSFAMPIRWISVGNHAIRLLQSAGCKKTEIMTLQSRESALLPTTNQNERMGGGPMDKIRPVFRLPIHLPARVRLDAERYDCKDER
jgi:hypothetical protein